MKSLRKIAAFFLDIIQTLVVAAAVFVIAYLFLFQPHQVIGNSMEPNFFDKEYILTDKISYRFRQPARGDVIIFKAPPDPEREYIKRAIGLPGERIKIFEGKIYLNGQGLNEAYLLTQSFAVPGSFLKEGEEMTIPPSYYFVLGDNRSHSSDSREWGFVSRTSIIGRAFLRYWPIPQVGLLPKASYSLF